MSEVLDALREKYPVYKDVSDDDLIFGLAKKFPVYLKQEPELEKAFRERTMRQPTPEPVGSAEDARKLIEKTVTETGGVKQSAEFDPLLTIPRVSGAEVSAATGGALGAKTAAVLNTVTTPLAEGLTSPAGIAALGAGGLGAATAKMAMVAFGLKGLTDLPEAERQAALKTVSTDEQEQLEGWLSAVVNPAFTGGMIGGTFWPKTPETIKVAQELSKQLKEAKIAPTKTETAAPVEARAGAAAQEEGLVSAQAKGEPSPVAGVPEARTIEGGYPKRNQPVAVPETPAEPYETVLETIRKAGAKTRNQIRDLFPLANLSKEQAARLRDQAWPEGEQTPSTPTEGAPNAVQVRSSEAIPVEVPPGDRGEVGARAPVEEKSADAQAPTTGPSPNEPKAGPDVLLAETEPPAGAGKEGEPSKAQAAADVEVKSSPIVDHWRQHVEPALHDFFKAASAFGVDRLERNRIKPEGVSLSDWIQQVASQKASWAGHRKTGTTGLEMLKQKNLWPTEGPEGEALRKSMLNAVQQLKRAPGSRGDWISNQERSPTQRTGTQEPPSGTSVGPGAASPGDVPAAPPQAQAAGKAVEQAPPENKPVGPVPTFAAALHDFVPKVQNTLKGIAGESMPITTAANREVGEAGVRYASSKVAAPFLARTFVAHTLEGTGVDPVKFGAALTEDNLRSVRESFRAKATEALAKGDEAAAEEFTKKADNVVTLIGSEKFPFKTEDEYFDYLERPDVKKAVGQHIQYWNEIIDPQYKQAQGIDPDVELPTRGQQTGARINLKAVLPDQPATAPVKGTVGSANLTATFKKKSPFAISAKGTGQAYDINYADIIGNTFERQLEIANKNRFDKSLVDAGLAVIDKPGQTVTIGGEPATAFPLTRRVVVSEGASFPQSQNIYVKRSLAGEYRRASNIDERLRVGAMAGFNTLVNKSALAGLTDASVHISNLATALFNRPISGPLFRDTLLSATGRSDVPLALTKAIVKGFRDNEAQLSELAEIGALRPGETTGNFMGRAIKKVDQVTRLVLDDTYQQLVKEGLVKDTETARREYVNQVGQYNRRLQPQFTRWLRETGFGPFVTAGKTFNAMGVRMVTLDPAVSPANRMASASLRVNALSKWVGAAAFIGAWNYLVSGNVLGRLGTPIGNLDMGGVDKSGKQKSFPLLGVLGLGRGLRVTGIKGALEAKRLGLTDADALDATSRDLINSWTAPGIGPPVRFGVTAATGFQPAVGIPRVAPVAPPGESQRKENFIEALRDANPVVKSFLLWKEGKGINEVMASQLPRFTIMPGKTESLAKNYPKIVSLAQGNEFIADNIGRARKMPQEERRAYLREQFNRLPQSQRQHAWNEAVRRKVIPPNK